MIELKIFSKSLKAERCKFGEVLEKCQNLRIFDIFWGILDKRKGSLGQECVEGMPLSL